MGLRGTGELEWQKRPLRPRHLPNAMGNDDWDAMTHAGGRHPALFVSCELLRRFLRDEAHVEVLLRGRVRYLSRCIMQSRRPACLNTAQSLPLVSSSCSSRCKSGRRACRRSGALCTGQPQRNICCCSCESLDSHNASNDLSATIYSFEQHIFCRLKWKECNTCLHIP